MTGTVEFDSRAITAGGLFLALPGGTIRRPRFRGAAIRSGAAAVLAARPVGVPAIVVPPAPAADAQAGCSSTTPTAPALRSWPRWPNWRRRSPRNW